MLSVRSLCLALLSAPLAALAQSTANAFKIPEGFSGSAGSPLTLNWTPTTTGTITLVLRSGASSNLDAGSVIASGLQNSGSYTWQIPADTVRGSDYAVEIVDDSDPTQINFTSYFVIDSSVTVATTSASIVSLGAVTSSVALSTASPTASALTNSSLNSVLSTASLSGSSTTTTGSSTLSTSASTTTGSSTSAASSASAGFQTTSATTNAAPKATAMAGMLGLVALGALAL